MPAYFAREGSRFTDEDAALIGPELERLASAGHSSTKDILEEGRDPGSPLHPFFEWRDEEAAEAHRRQQAREIAGSILVRVKVRNGYRTIRAFQSVVVATEERTVPSRQYVHVNTVRESPPMAAQVVDDVASMLQRAAKKYDLYREAFPVLESRFGPVFEMIESLYDEAA